VISEIEAVGQKPSPLTTKTIRSLPTKDRQSLASKKANTNQTGTVSAYQNANPPILGE
jgi:phage FluMu protein gp41